MQLSASPMLTNGLANSRALCPQVRALRTSPLPFALFSRYAMPDGVAPLASPATRKEQPAPRSALLSSTMAHSDAELVCSQAQSGHCAHGPSLARLLRARFARS